MHANVMLLFSRLDKELIWMFQDVVCDEGIKVLFEMIQPIVQFDENASVGITYLTPSLWAVLGWLGIGKDGDGFGEDFRCSGALSRRKPIKVSSQTIPVLLEKNFLWPPLLTSLRYHVQA